MYTDKLSGTGKHTMTITIETDHLIVMTKMLGLLKELDSYADAMKAPMEWGYSTARREAAAPAVPAVKARKPRKQPVQVEQPAPVEPFPAPTAPRKVYRRPTLTPIDVPTFAEMCRKDSALFWRWRDGAGKWMPELQQEIGEFQREARESIPYPVGLKNDKTSILRWLIDHISYFDGLTDRLMIGYIKGRGWQVVGDTYGVYAFSSYAVAKWYFEQWYRTGKRPSYTKSIAYLRKPPVSIGGVA